MLIPSIDLMGGRIVQLVRGAELKLAFDNFEYWIERFASYPMVQLIDLDAAMRQGDNAALIEKIAKRLPCQVGGGIRTAERAKTLLSATELGLFTRLAGNPTDGETLARQLGLHARSARDFLDALVALGFLDRNGNVYSNSPESDLFLDRAKPTYLGGLLEMANARLYPFWASLTEGLRTGMPQNEMKTGQGNSFEALYADPERLRGFLKATHADTASVK